PSGSSHGQVVATNPAFATRALARIELDGDTPPALPEGHHLITVLQRKGGQKVAVVDRPAHSRIRGVHFADPGEPHPDDGPARDGSPPESEPLAGDLLNPQAVQCFINL